MGPGLGHPGSEIRCRRLTMKVTADAIHWLAVRGNCRETAEVPQRPSEWLKRQRAADALLSRDPRKFLTIEFQLRQESSEPHWRICVGYDPPIVIDGPQPGAEAECKKISCNEPNRSSLSVRWRGL